MAAGDQTPGLALGNVLDLRRCGVELGTTVLLTWLIRCAQMRGAGLVVHNQWVKLITGELAGRGWERAAGSNALQRVALVR